MEYKPRSLVCSVALSLLVLPLLAFAAFAEDASPGGDGTKAEDKAIREQSIYIPYEKLRQVFEKEGRGVFLPYEKFQELWKAAREHDKPTVEPKPPVPALITEISNEADVEKDVVRVKAKLKIEILAEGWHEIPLRLADCAITQATVGGKAARILGRPGQDYRLLVEKKGKQPEELELNIEYAKAIVKAPGQNSVSFQAPQAPVSRWTVTIPQSGVKVNIQPLIAATETPAGTTPEGKPREATVLMAFAGAAPEIRIDWTPKAEGASGLAALASVQAEGQVLVSEGVVRTRTQLNYAISRAELSQLLIEVPADQKVVNVFDANVRQWAVETKDDRQTITAQLFEPAKGSQRVMVELEKFIEDKAQTSLTAPVVKAVGVGRQQGVVVVGVAEGLRVEAPKTNGLMQIDAGELPPALQGGRWAFAYRYSAVPFELALEIEKVQPRITVDSLVEAYLAPERVTLDLSAVCTIERAGVFRIEFDIPEGFEVRQVRGREMPGASAAAVDSHHLEGEKKTRLVVNLTRKALGKAALLVEMQREHPQRELLAQPGKEAEILLAVPSPAPGTVQRSAGRLMIYAPESLRVNPRKADGLGEITFEKALEGMQTARDQKPQGARPVLSWSFTDEAAAVTLAAERRKPKVTMRQTLVARIDNGVAKYEAAFDYDVQYSGVKSLRIDIPLAIAEEVRNETQGIQENTIQPQPDDVAEGCVAKGFSGNNEFLGSGRIKLVWEKKLDAIEVGKPVKLDVPRLQPRDVDRAWGQIVLVKTETLDLDTPAEPEGLRPIDPQQDIDPAHQTAGAARAFEFHDAWKLPLTVTQYQLTDIKRTSIERAVVRMVVTPSGEAAVQALYRIRSVQQRLALKLPEANFDTTPLRVNGRPVSLERGAADEYFIPLTDSNPDSPVLVEIRYSTPAKDGRLVPVFPEDSGVLKVYLSVWLPEDRELLGVTGPWSEEFLWRIDPRLRWRPQPARVAGNEVNDAWLCQWVSEGIGLSANPFENLSTDGVRYLYSTLSPASGSSLRLVTADVDWFRAGIFLAAVALGIVLLPTGLGTRAAAIGAALTALVLAVVFCPTLAMQLLGATTTAAVFVVLVLWIVWFFIRTWPAMAARREAALLAMRAAAVANEPAAKPLGGVGAGIDLSRREPSEPAQDASQDKPQADKGENDHA